MRFTKLFVFLLPIFLAGCGKDATIEILQTTNISSKVAAICEYPRNIRITDISEDGSVIVGKCKKKEAPNEYQFFSYSQSVGAKIISAKGIEGWNGIRISADGLVIWGDFSIGNDDRHIFRYTVSEGFQDLGTMGKHGMSVSAVSSDGSEIVGTFRDPQTARPMLYHAFRYSQSQGFEDLSSLNTDSTHARGVSADGSWIVGTVSVGTSSEGPVRYITNQPFRYSRQEGIKVFGEAGWGEMVFPNGISNDGSVVFGQADFSIGFIVSIYSSSHDFIYTEKHGKQKLNEIGRKKLRVTRISGDGTKLIGQYRDPNGESYVYTAKLGS